MTRIAGHANTKCSDLVSLIPTQSCICVRVGVHVHASKQAQAPARVCVHDPSVAVQQRLESNDRYTNNVLLLEGAALSLYPMPFVCAQFSSRVKTRNR